MLASVNLLGLGILLIIAIAAAVISHNDINGKR